MLLHLTDCVNIKFSGCVLTRMWWFWSGSVPVRTAGVSRWPLGLGSRWCSHTEAAALYQCRHTPADCQRSRFPCPCHPEHRHRHRHTDTQTHRHTDTQTHTHTHTQTHTHTDTHRHRHTQRAILPDVVLHLLTFICSPLNNVVSLNV